MTEFEKLPKYVQLALGRSAFQSLPTEPRTYALASAPLINTPGLLSWAIDGYKFAKDRPYLLNIFTEGWSGPKAPSPVVFDRLLRGEIEYTVEESECGGTVVFSA